jgi:uncharacterized protein
MSFGRGLDARSSARQAVVFTLAVLALVGIGVLLARSGALEAPGAGNALRVVGDVVLHALVLLGLIAILLRVAGQHWTTLGLGRESPARSLGFGLLGVLMAYFANIVVVGIYLAITRPDLVQIGEQKMRALDPLATIPAALLVPVAVLVGVYEEIAFRGFLLSRLRAALSAKLPSRVADAGAVLGSAAIFALGHAYQGMVGVIQTAGAGVAFAVLALWRGSIWPCIVAHVVIDVFALVVMRLLRGG